jgi:acyl-CoA thioesterase-1
MPPFVWFLASGDAFFAGAGLVLCAAGISAMKKGLLRNVVVYLMSLAGASLVTVSATPLPQTFYVFWAAIVLAWLVCVAFVSEKQTAVVRWSAVVATAFCAAAILVEVPCRRMPKIAGQFKTLCVIGDSVSAGMGNDAEQTWPRILRGQWIEVIDRSRAGATVSSALRRQVGGLPENAIVVLEIGGNDLLGVTPTPHAEFERDLRGLLETASGGGRTLVMLELPLLPWHVEYGRIQRRLAREFKAALLPKRYLAGIFAAEGATSDGIHLTPQGQRLMADRMRMMLGESILAAK